METEQLTEIVLPGVVDPEGLRLRTSPVPAPGAGQVVIRMEATGVSFAEQQMRRGRYYDQPTFPFVPGYDLVGTLTAVGAGADASLLGQRVAALTKVGGWASHVTVDAADAVAVPPGLDPAAAETVVLNGITAWQMLHRKARVKSGQTILVHGANGGVGSTLAQLARLAGVRVIGTAAPRHHDSLRDLGVIPVDYHADVPAAVREIAPRRGQRRFRPPRDARPARLVAAARPRRHPGLLRKRGHPGRHRLQAAARAEDPRPGLDVERAAQREARLPL
jgi:NADPH:quinone reductase-like Zn-dependent oxidoreductase